MARRTLSKEEREAKRAAEREQVKAAVEALQSSEGWQAWLAVRRRFRTYSPLNQLLIALQKPDATKVAGFKAWLNLGYCVRKGEKAIRIYAKRALSHLMQSATVAASVHRGGAWVGGGLSPSVISFGVCGSL